MDRLTGEGAESYRRRIAAADQSAQIEPYKGDFENETRTLISTARQSGLPQKTIYSLVSAYRRLAQAAVAKVISLAPESSWAALLRAQAAENIEVAEKEYERAVRSSDAELESYVRFGQFQAKHSRFDQALTLYEKALTFEPNNPRVMGLIGELHTLQEQPEKAVPFLEAALKANPRETQTRLYLAQSLVKLSRTSEAVKILEDAPEDVDGRIHYLLSRTYQQQGETEKARKSMEEFRKRRKTATP
jgi:tetratricopeptide (TPR) repeat protein